jgi:DNA helicase TIP49 (TBP-interacting protein)
VGDRVRGFDFAAQDVESEVDPIIVFASDKANWASGHL